MVTLWTCDYQKLIGGFLLYHLSLHMPPAGRALLSDLDRFHPLSETGLVIFAKPHRQSLLGGITETGYAQLSGRPESPGQTQEQPSLNPTI